MISLAKVRKYSTNLQTVLDQYGADKVEGLFSLHSTGPGCKSSGDFKCEGFYTWDALTRAIDAYNEHATAQGHAQFLDDATVDKKARTLLAFMANIWYETAQYTACKERILAADRSCPAHKLHIPGGCSAGMLGDYTSAKAKAAGFFVTTCGGKTAPAQGCKDFWGSEVVPPQNCWFGRGALQLTWPGNYNAVNDKLSVDLCSDPDAVCRDGSVGFEAAIAFWMSNHGPWRESYNMMAAVTQVVAPADTHTNHDRVKTYAAWLGVLGITRAAAAGPVAPPVQGGGGRSAVGATTRCGNGWADANSKCGAPCPGGTDAECAASGGGKCFGSLDPKPCANAGGGAPAPQPSSPVSKPAAPPPAAPLTPASSSTTAYVTYHMYSAGDTLTTVACSDGKNGLMTRWRYSNLGGMYPYVTAWSKVRWNSPLCGTCLKLMHGANVVYLTAVDMCGPPNKGDDSHFDIAPPAFEELFGSKTAGFYNHVAYEIEPDTAKCKGNGGGNSAPARLPPTAPASPPAPATLPLPAPPPPAVPEVHTTDVPIPAPLPPPVPPPAATPPGNGGSCIAEWKACLNKPAACCGGLTCQGTKHWKACKKPANAAPAAPPASPAAAVPPPAVPARPAGGSCIAEWKACLNKLAPCCTGFTCQGTKWWKSCKK